MKESQFLTRMRRDQTIVEADGNKAWKSEAIRLGLHVQSVHAQVYCACQCF